MNSHAIRLTQTPGRCRWCRCTDDAACDGGCSWVNRQHTVCSACEAFDVAMRTVGGRAELARFAQEHGFQW